MKNGIEAGRFLTKASQIKSINSPIPTTEMMEPTEEI
jgi:hypothetical protein